MEEVYYIYVDHEYSGDRTPWRGTFFTTPEAATAAIPTLVPQLYHSVSRVGHLVKYKG